MLILILIDVQYLQKAVFGIEKGLNCPIKICDPPSAPPPLCAISKTLEVVPSISSRQILPITVKKH